jgi:WD40 repeat protein
LKFIDNGRLLFKPFLRPIIVWESSTREQKIFSEKHTDPWVYSQQRDKIFSGHALSYDEKYIAAITEEKSVTIRKADNGEIVQVINDFNDDIYGVIFSPNCAYVAITSYNVTRIYGSP